MRLFARRFSVHERIGQQLADALERILTPHGVAVHLEAVHLCMRMRGGREIESTTAPATGAAPTTATLSFERRGRAQGSEPGTAPDTPGLAPGVSRISDLDDEARQMLGLYVALLGGLSFSNGDSASTAKGPLGTTRGELMSQSDKGFRFVRADRGVVAIPPDCQGIPARW